MTTPDHLYGSKLAEQQFESERDFLLRSLSDLVDGIAANEVTYEIAAAAPLTDTKVNLADLAEEVDRGRTDIVFVLDCAIAAARGIYRAKHQQTLEKAD